jgi:predicted amidophosphoribosyltransferase
VADDHLLVRRKIVDGVAICGNCGVRLVNVEERIRCKFCWNCGKPILWR